jgi:quinol monooxygenase YgiN
MADPSMQRTDPNIPDAARSGRRHQETEVMIALSVSMRFSPEDKVKVEEYVRKLAELSRKDPGCVEYWWAPSMEDPQALRLFEVWESEELLQEHLTQPHEKEFMSDYLPRVLSAEVITYDPTTRGTR